MLRIGVMARFLSLSAAAALLVSCMACGSPTCRNPDGEIGSCCRDTAECGSDLECFSEFPAGLCSLDCAPAGVACPSGSSCVNIKSKSTGDMGSFCLSDCGDGLPACREGYACTQTSIFEIKVCFPD